MKGFVFIDGQILPVSEAKVSVYDHGFLYGDGLFETMRTYGGKIYRLDLHLNRLHKAAESLQIKIPYTSEELTEALYQTVKRNNLSGESYIRLSLTRGTGPIGLDPALCDKASVIIMVKEIAINKTIYEQGIEAIIVKTLRNPVEATDPGLKSMNFLNNIFAKIEVKKAGKDEGILLNTRGEITEATVDNLFLVKNGVLITPPLTAGILPGITRSLVLEMASKSIETREETLYPKDLYEADEVFLTNSISEIIPIIRIDSYQIGIGEPGPVTKKIHEAYRKLAFH